MCGFVVLLAIAAALGPTLAACGAGGQTPAAKPGNDLLGKTFPSEPKALWPRIVPMYKDGDVLKRFFGERGDKAIYVAVLDKDSVIRAFLAEPFV